MLDSLVTTLRNLNGNTTNATVYLNTLTVDQLNVLYPLFIEAPEELIRSFSTLSSFQTVVNRAVKIEDANCCDYARSNRKIFAEYALPFITSNARIAYSNLLALGKCFATVLPLDKFLGMDATDFLNYFPNIGRVYQPDTTETSDVIAKINALTSSQSSQETFVFTTLKDLAMYYSNLSNLSSVSRKHVLICW